MRDTNPVSQRGILLLNLGTPSAPTPQAVGPWLREFLMDPLVLDVPTPLRWLIVNAFIVPRRKHQSAALYQRVWTKHGSPLLANMRSLAEQLKSLVGGSEVRLAMRYGEPSIRDALAELRATGVTTLEIVPLYPQYSTAASESSVLAVRAALTELDWKVATRWVRPFFDDPAFLDATAAVARQVLAERPHDAVLFSFHGLPERQVKRTDASGTHCLATPGCCDTIVEANRLCYRAHSYATARGLAARLLPNGTPWYVGFQSRLGGGWIKPYSDTWYEQLPKQGIRRIAVLAPSFVSDCLETLEEISLRGNEAWKANGGEELFLVPCVNASPEWVTALASIIEHASPEWSTDVRAPAPALEASASAR
jgi:ferrochelatase